MKPGATGRFPKGKIDPTDEGELYFTVGHTNDGDVRLEFGKPVAWMQMPPKIAREIGVKLIEHAEAGEKLAGPQ